MGPQKTRIHTRKPNLMQLSSALRPHVSLKMIFCSLFCTPICKLKGHRSSTNISTASRCPMKHSPCYRKLPRLSYSVNIVEARRQPHLALLKRSCNWSELVQVKCRKAANPCETRADQQAALVACLTPQFVRISINFTFVQVMKSTKC